MSFDQAKSILESANYTVMKLVEAKQILKKASYICESVRLVNNLDQFVELLSNCIGEIPGDELVFKSAMDQPYYTVRFRNSGKKLAEIMYNRDNAYNEIEGIRVTIYYGADKVRNDYTFEELTLSKIKAIGAMLKSKINKDRSMELKEAKQILKDNGYVLERYDLDYDSVNSSFDQERRLEKFGEYLYEVRELLVRKGFSRGKQADNYDELNDIAHRCCRLGKSIADCAKEIILKIK